VTRAFVSLALATLVLVALQLAVVSPLRLFGVVIMVVWLWPMAVALTVATPVGVAVGVVTGLLFDAHAVTPFGASAVVGGVLALGVGALAREGVGDLDGAALWVPSALAAAAGLAAPVLFVIASAIAGRSSVWHSSLVTTMAINMVFFALLVRPLARVAQRATASSNWSRA
jgi:cell shape-determining protein MreD